MMARILAFSWRNLHVVATLTLGVVFAALCISLLAVDGVVSVSNTAPAVLSTSGGMHYLNELNVVTLAPRSVKKPLAGNEARFLLLDRQVSTEAVLNEMLAGKGENFAGKEILGDRSPAHMGKSLFILYAYRSVDKSPLLTRYRAMGISRMATWVSLNVEKPHFVLAGVSGSDVVGVERLKWLPDYVPDSLIPAAVIPGTEGKIGTVFMRLDASVPYYPVVRIMERAAFEYEIRERYYLLGLLIGATFIAICMALIGAVRHKSLDFLLLIFCILILGVWSSVKSEQSPIFDVVAWRRFVLSGLLFLYFFANTLATQRLLKKPELSLKGIRRYRHIVSAWQVVPICLSLAINAFGLILAGIYAVFGDYAPAVIYIESMMMLSSGCTPLLLLIASGHAIARKVQGAAIVFSAQLIAALGFVLQIVRAFTTVLDQPIFGLLISYSLMLDATVWAVALAARYQYLDFIAKKKIDDALKEEARRVRAEAAEAGRARDEAFEREKESLRGLRHSYDALYEIQKGVYAMSVMTHHDMRNAIDKVRMTMDDLALDRLLPDGGRVLRNNVNNLREGMEKVNQATRALLSREAYHAAPLAQIIERLLEYMDAQLSERGLFAFVDLQGAEGVLVDEYPCHAVINELLVNAVRYASPDSMVRITGKLVFDEVVIRFCTQSDISEERRRQLIHEKVEPDMPLTGEKSSGTGLYNLRRVLEPAGASIAVDRQDRQGLTIVLRLPVR